MLKATSVNRRKHRALELDGYSHRNFGLMGENWVGWLGILLNKISSAKKAWRMEKEYLGPFLYKNEGDA